MGTCSELSITYVLNYVLSELSPQKGAASDTYALDDKHNNPEYNQLGQGHVGSGLALNQLLKWVPTFLHSQIMECSENFSRLCPSGVEIKRGARPHGAGPSHNQSKVKVVSGFFFSLLVC